MDRITRKELKQDKFAVEVTHTVGYLAEHRSQAIRYAVIGVVVVVLVAGLFTWRTRSRAERRDALASALDTYQTPVGPSQGDSQVRTFPTEDAKNKAVIAAFSGVAAKYSGSEEGTIAEYYLAAVAADQGNTAGAEKALQQVIDSGNDNYASLAKLTLADLYQSDGKTADAEKLVRSVVDKPTQFVSKEQATLALARLLAPTNPAEARKLLTPLRVKQSPVITRQANAQLAALPPK